MTDATELLHQPVLLAEALAGRVDPSIPESTKVAIVAMRQYIDSLSGEYLSILQKQVEANMEGADQALIDKISWQNWMDILRRTWDR